MELLNMINNLSQDDESTPDYEDIAYRAEAVREATSRFLLINNGEIDGTSLDDVLKIAAFLLGESGGQPVEYHDHYHIKNDADFTFNAEEAAA